MRDDISYLAGLWDADGTIGIYKRSSYYVPSASFCSTNEVLIKYVASILDKHDIEYRVDYIDRKERENAAPAWHVKLESRPRVTKLLNLLAPYLVAKKEQAELVLEWFRI